MNGMTTKALDDVSAMIAMFGAQLTDPRQPFTLLIRFQTKATEHENAERAFARARAPTLREKGVMIFEMNREASDPAQFVVYERWESLAALETHLRTPYITRLREEFNDMIVGDPEFNVLLPAAQ